MQVKIEPTDGDGRPLLVECDSDLEMITGLHVEDALVNPAEENLTQVVISNMPGCSSYVSSGMLIDRAVRVEVVDERKSSTSDSGSTPMEEEQTKEPSLVQNIKSVDDRKEELRRWVGSWMKNKHGIVGSYHSSSHCLLFG